MKTIRSKIAYAVVNKDHPSINILDIFIDGDIVLRKSEMLIKVLITPVTKKK